MIKDIYRYHWTEEPGEVILEDLKKILKNVTRQNDVWIQIEIKLSKNNNLMEELLK